MKLMSNFEDGAAIPRRYTCEADDWSPPLDWTEAPDGTRSFALICDDPDAPSPARPAVDPWVHWVIFNIPGDADSLPEGISCAVNPAEIPGAQQGRNSWPNDNTGYRGPLPPPGSGTHRYFFRLYALDATIVLATEKADKANLLDAIQGHLLAQAELMGTYQRG